MNSNIKAHAIESMDGQWENILVKFPDENRLGKFKVKDKHGIEHVLIGFARKGNIYVFSFVTGTYFPLSMMIEEVNDKKDLGMNENDVLYSYLSEKVLQAIPGYSRIIAEMESVKGDEE